LNFDREKGTVTRVITASAGAAAAVKRGPSRSQLERFTPAINPA